MSLEIRDSVQADLDYALEHPYDQEYIKGFPTAKLIGYNKTTLINGKVSIVGGVVLFWPHVGECWFVLTDNCHGCEVAAVFELRRIMNQMIEELQLHRLQCVIRTDFKKTIKMAEYFGFKRDCILKKYSQYGEDSYLYSIVKD